MFCHEDTACIIQSPSEWPFSSVAQIKLHMNQVIFEPDIRLRRTNHYKVKYLLSRETLRNSKHHVEKLYTASRLVAFNTEDVLLQPWLGIDYCVAVFLCNQLNELPDGPVQHSPTVTDPDGQNIKKAPMPWGGGVLTLPLKPSTVVIFQLNLDKKHKKGCFCSNMKWYTVHNLQICVCVRLIS